MKISTKGRYSVTALYELALRYGEGAVSLKSIATSQGLSENYLEQLMAPLRRAGIVKSVRGAQGGYMLARDPKEITIGEIITTVEGPIALVDCLLTSAESAEQPCDLACACVTRWPASWTARATRSTAASSCRRRRYCLPWSAPAC